MSWSGRNRPWEALDQCHGVSTLESFRVKQSNGIIIFMLRKTFDGNEEEGSIKRKFREL